MRVAFTLLWLAALTGAATAQVCRQALILGLDVSLSVDAQDHALQRGGLASALTDAEVVEAMLGPMGTHVELAIFEWSGNYDQVMLVDWTPIASVETLKEIAELLIGTPLQGRVGRTALGAAMLFAKDSLATRAHCRQHTLDLSGDGPNNTGTSPQSLHQAMSDAGITVNALVIEPTDTDDAKRHALSRYFEANVIAGRGAFVETVYGFTDYQDGIRRKLLRELAPAMSHRSPGPTRRAAR